jgi:hypothetical protein
MNDDPAAPVETRPPRAALGTIDHLTAFVPRVVASRLANTPRPDPDCMAAGRTHLANAIRCLIAAGLGNEVIAATVHRWLHEAGCMLPDDRYRAATPNQAAP